MVCLQTSIHAPNVSTHRRTCFSLPCAGVLYQRHVFVALLLRLPRKRARPLCLSAPRVFRHRAKCAFLFTLPNPQRSIGVPPGKLANEFGSLGCRNDFLNSTELGKHTQRTSILSTRALSFQHEHCRRSSFPMMSVPEYDALCGTWPHCPNALNRRHENNASAGVSERNLIGHAVAA